MQTDFQEFLEGMQDEKKDEYLVPILVDRMLAQGEAEDLERLQLQGTLYPGSFPAGPLEGSNRFISQAEVSQEGSSLAVRLTLTEDANQYTVSSREYLGPADSGPYLRLSLREPW